MMTKTYILIFGLLLSTAGAFAQGIEFDKKNFENNKEGFKEAKKNLKEGDAFYEQGNLFYKDAIPFYVKANTFNPDNALLNFKLGECYMHSLYKPKALPFLEKALKLDSKINPDVHFYLGQAYHLKLEFDKAINSFQRYQSTALQNPDPYIVQEIKSDLKMRTTQCRNGKELIKAPVRVFIDNLGDNINTEFNEYGGVISADESVLIFTARRPSSTGGKIDPTLNETFEDLYISRKLEEGTWEKAKNIGKPVNTSDHDAVSAISADGQRFIVYLGRKSHKGDLFECVLEGDVWSKPESLGNKINSNDFHESSACYSPDGNTIYFVSNKDGGMGKHDIYISHKTAKGKWGEPETIGSVINTEYNEEGVFMHPDGKTLYFSSEGHNSMGGYDIFKS
ncbi:MAG: PD40 domain-containing protein, partial [Crocinitomicaceae bacterium]|nr:PD40 domain-containing protein [Crocinitomicaceae bacterium]